jgi:DNA-binding transcriptional ArsR family regulator
MRQHCARATHPLTYNDMVVGVATAADAEDRADRLFHALSDGTRRDIVLRSMQGEHSVSALARLYPMSFAAVQKHVAVLERAGLLTKQLRGREQLVRGNVQAVHDAHRLLDRFEAMWRRRIERFGDVLAATDDGDSDTT